MDSQRQLLRDRGICVIIPTYNNVATIRQVVEGALSQCADVIVVCDGCTDGTDTEAAKVDGAVIVSYQKNRGKGHALKVGFREARRRGFAYAITIDADGQHYPSDIANMLEANIANPGALIVGSRELSGVDRTKGSTFANKFSNFWFTIQTLRRVRDTQSGYRLYPLKKLWFLPLVTSRYEAELELLVFASWHGVKIREIPISVYYPSREERVSHFRPALDFTRISILNTLLCGLAIIYALPVAVTRGALRVGRTLYTLLFFLTFATLIFQPFIWLYFKIGGATERKCERLHRWIMSGARFVTLRHGIPGTRFSQHVADASCFDKPSVIICNHQSHFDLVTQLIFTPKIIFLTNDWVWRNPLYGSLIHRAEYIPVRRGIDEIIPQLRDLVSRGYSIAVYPEGHRSRDCHILRFHQGAFHIAEALGLDIIPMCLYGPGKVLPPRSYLMCKSPIRIEVKPRVSRDQLSAMGNTRQQASAMRRMYIQWYQQLSNQIEQDV